VQEAHASVSIVQTMAKTEWKYTESIWSRCHVPWTLKKEGSHNTGGGGEYKKQIKKGE